MDSNAKRERDGTTTSTSAMHQNSNSTVKLCPHTINASSPNNASDQSNSSNISINLSQTIESGTTDILQDLNISEKSGNKKKTNLNSLATVKEEETGNLFLHHLVDLVNMSLFFRCKVYCRQQWESLGTFRKEFDMQSHVIKFNAFYKRRN